MMLATRTTGLLRALAMQPMQTQRARQVLTSNLGSGSDWFKRTLFTQPEERIKQGAHLLKPPKRLVKHTDEVKSKIARDISDWVEPFLRCRNVKVAIVSRQGSEYAKLFDPTGMTHSGIAVYDPERKTYDIYNLINHVHGNPSQGITPKAAVFLSTPEDFFYEQIGKIRDALIMIPPKGVQETMWDAIQEGNYKSLDFTPDYNMVSVPHTKDSQSCTKWSLMNIVAAHLKNYDPQAVLKSIEETFKPGLVDVPPVFRPVVKKVSPFVQPDEIPKKGPIHAVTVESLYHSGLFEERHFYNTRELPPPPATEPSLASKTCSRIALGGRLLGVAAREHLLKQGVLKDRRLGH